MARQHRQRLALAVRWSANDVLRLLTSAMSGLLRSGSDAYHVTAAQRALVPSCVSSRDQRLSIHLDLFRPAGPDGVDAQVGGHGRRTAVKRPVRERLVTVELFRRSGQPVVFQPPAFDRQQLTERGPGLAAA